LHVRRPALESAQRHEEGDTVPFIKVPGVSGKVYVPESCSAASKKHPCGDCFGCQRCSDDRCNLCRGADPGQGRNKEKTRECEILPC